MRLITRHRLLALLAPAVAAAAAAAASLSPAAPVQSPSPSPPPPPPAVIPLTRVDIGPVFGPIYTLAFSVGTPPQAVRLAVDSWSSDIWVATPRSLGNSTVPHRAFDPALSASFRARNVSSHHLPYPHAGSNGSSVDVDVGEDVGDLENAGTGLGVGAGAGGAPAAPGGPPNPLARRGVVLGVASREDAFFLENPAFDGMMGLALDQGAQLDAWGALSRLANESGVPFVFGLYLAQPSGAAPANGSASAGAGASFGDGASSGLAVGAPDARRFADPLAEPVYSPVLAREGTGGAVFDVWRFALPHMQLTVQRRAHAFAEAGEAGTGDAAAAAAAAAVAADEPDAPGAPLSFCGPDDAAAGCIALLDLSRDTIAFPGSTYSRILAAVNGSAHGHCAFAPPPAPPGTVLCPSLLEIMPNITFTVSAVADPLVARSGVVGRGVGAGVGTGVGAGRSKKPLSYYDLEMMPADYCELVFVPGNHSLAKASACRLLFSALGEYRSGRHPYAASAAALRMPPSPTAAPPATEPSVLLLGAPFLRAFYSVFDGRVAGGARVGFAAASSTASVLPSAWRPPSPPPPGGGSALPSWLGSKEMWAGVVGVGVGFVITGGLVVVLRDRCRERQSRRNARQMREELLFGFDESGSIMIEDRDLDDDDDYEHEDGFGFDDDESLAASGLSASVSMPGGSSGGAAATSAPPSPSAAPPAPAVAGAGGSAAGAAAIDVLRLDVGGLVGATARGYRDLQ